MEDTLGVSVAGGTCTTVGLNPCSNGRYSWSPIAVKIVNEVKVLILVLMEDTLGGVQTKNEYVLYGVLILVLMEDTLGGRNRKKRIIATRS